MTTANIRFEREDVERFALASHDRNQLHLSDLYARRSVFGEPIIFGILGVLGAVGLGPHSSAKAIEKISITFRRPLYVGVTYQVRCDERRSGQLKLSIENAGVMATTAIINLRDGAVPDWPRKLPPGSAPTSKALAGTQKTFRPVLPYEVVMLQTRKRWLNLHNAITFTTRGSQPLRPPYCFGQAIWSGWSCRASAPRFRIWKSHFIQRRQLLTLALTMTHAWPVLMTALIYWTSLPSYRARGNRSRM